MHPLTMFIFLKFNHRKPSILAHQDWRRKKAQERLDHACLRDDALCILRENGALQLSASPQGHCLKLWLFGSPTDPFEYARRWISQRLKEAKSLTYTR